MDKDSALLLNAGAHYIKVLRQFDKAFSLKTVHLVPIVGIDD